MTGNKQKMMLDPEAILKYLMGDEELQNLIVLKSTEIDLMTTDQYIYEALASVEDRSKINLNLLVKMLEVVTIQPHQEALKEDRKILTPEKADELRKRVEK